jgi:hypothetical protein
MAILCNALLSSRLPWGIEAVAALLAGGGVERRDAGEPCELRVAAKAGDPGGLADQLGGDQHAAALQRQELGGVVGDEHGELALERVGLGCELATAAHEVARDAHLDGLPGARQPPRDAIQPDFAIQCADGHPQLGVDRVQQPAQAVLGLTALTHQRFAMVNQQLDVTSRPIFDRGREVVVRERGAGDRQRVDAVGLPIRATAAARARHQLGRHAQHPLAARDQEPLQTAADSPNVLNRPRALAVQGLGPGQHLCVPARARGRGQLVHELAAARRHGDRGVRLLVRVDSDHQRHLIPFSAGRKAELQRTSLNRATGQAPLRSR